MQKIIGDIELHDMAGIRQCFENGIDPNQIFRGEPLIYELISEYTRSPKFKLCVAEFVRYGLQFEDEALLAVLLDDDKRLNELLKCDNGFIQKRYTLRCAYTQMLEVSLLHICAEFNHVECAKVLAKYGIDSNVKAGIDEFGFGGQTPIYHTVNQNSHASKEMMEFLLGLDVDLTGNIRGLIWGKGYDWETFIPSVNAISYTMMGLLPQLHRSEETINSVVQKLMEQAYGIEYAPKNVPNKYLA